VGVHLHSGISNDIAAGPLLKAGHLSEQFFKSGQNSTSSSVW